MTSALKRQRCGFEVLHNALLKLSDQQGKSLVDSVAVLKNGTVL